MPRLYRCGHGEDRPAGTICSTQPHERRAPPRVRASRVEDCRCHPGAGEQLLRLFARSPKLECRRHCFAVRAAAWPCAPRTRPATSRTVRSLHPGRRSDRHSCRAHRQAFAGCAPPARQSTAAGTASGGQGRSGRSSRRSRTVPVFDIQPATRRERFRVDDLNVTERQRPDGPSVQNFPDPVSRNTKPRGDLRRTPAANEEQQNDAPLRVGRRLL